MQVVKVKQLCLGIKDLRQFADLNTDRYSVSDFTKMWKKQEGSVMRDYYITILLLHASLNLWNVCPDSYSNQFILHNTTKEKKNIFSEAQIFM